MVGQNDQIITTWRAAAYSIKHVYVLNVIEGAKLQQQIRTKEYAIWGNIQKNTLLRTCTTAIAHDPNTVNLAPHTLDVGWYVLQLESHRRGVG